MATARHAEARPRHQHHAALVWAPRILLFVVCLLAASVTLLPAALGYQRYVITGGSMTGAIDKGSVVYDKVVPVSSLHVGDVITYRPPAGSTPGGGLVTHRIVGITTGADGRLVFQSKGDTNRAVDPWTFHLDGAKPAKVDFHLPWIGYFLGLLGIGWLRVALVGLLSALVVVRVWWALWRDAGREERAREGKRAAPARTEAPVFGETPIAPEATGAGDRSETSAESGRAASVTTDAALAAVAAARRSSGQALAGLDDHGPATTPAPADGRAERVS